MTLSKTISISLSRSSIFIFLFLLLVSNAYCAEFRLAIVSESEEYKTLLEDVLSVYDSSISSDWARERISLRLERDAENDYKVRYSSLLKGENFKSLDTLKKNALDIGSLSLSIVSPVLSDTEMEYLLSGDKDAVEYIKLREKLDMIISVSSEYDAPLYNISLYIDSDNVRNTLYSPSLEENELDALFAIFTPLFCSDEYVLLNFDFPSNGTLYIDGEMQNLYTSRVVLKKGVHEIAYSIPGYISKKLVADISSTDEALSLNLEKVDGKIMYISTIPASAKIMYNGKEIENRILDSVVYPFTITAQADGFSLYSMQSSKPMDSITISLKPKWMDNDSILSYKKGDFYSSLFSTLLLFGGYVASQTLSSLMPEYNLAPVTVVMAGVSLVSLINMVDSMFEYFNSARLGI